jgi:hypothetical protein
MSRKIDLRPALEEIISIIDREGWIQHGCWMPYETPTKTVGVSIAGALMMSSFGGTGFNQVFAGLGSALTAAYFGSGLAEEIGVTEIHRGATHHLNDLMRSPDDLSRLLFFTWKESGPKDRVPSA